MKIIYDPLEPFTETEREIIKELVQNALSHSEYYRMYAAEIDDCKSIIEKIDATNYAARQSRNNRSA